MSQADLNSAILSALVNLYTVNEHLYDYWLSELYDNEDGSDNVAVWNEETLDKIETDLMHNL